MRTNVNPDHQRIRKVSRPKMVYTDGTMAPLTTVEALYREHRRIHVFLDKSRYHKAKDLHR